MSAQPRQWVLVNGEIVPAHAACVSVFDSSFLQGIGLFETLRAYGGQVFRLERHVDRLVQSAQSLGWTAVPDGDVLAAGVVRLLSAAQLGDARVRLTVTTGSLQAQGDHTPELTVVASVDATRPYPPEYYRNGVTVVMSQCCRSPEDPTAGHKTTSYFDRLASLRAAHTTGAFEVLWRTATGDVAQAALGNLFVVRNEQLLTPPVAARVVPGITRATVMELAVERGIPVREAMLSVEDVVGADEVFLTNTMVELMPVVRIGRERIGNEKPGDVTRDLAGAFGDLLDREA